MQPTSLALLEDIDGRCTDILRRTRGRTLDDYEADEDLRLAVERSFEIVGEALLRLERRDPAVIERITQPRQVIAFRNRLAHGYDVIDNAAVWDIINTTLLRLHAEVRAILAEEEQ